MFLINHILTGSQQGCTKVPGGECYGIAWGHHFQLHERWMNVSTTGSMLQVRVSAQCTRQMHIHSHQKEHGITGTSYDDVLMMLGIFG